MKELSIEQKARRYDEAIKKAESLYKAAEPMSGCNVIIETLFPELKESKDEMIRKEIIAILKHKYGKYHNDPKYRNIPQWIAWLKNIPVTIDHEKREGFHLGYKACLEKQGEQKPNPCDGCINRKGCINCENGELREIEHKPTEWSEEDETALGDALWCCKQAASIAKDENDMGNVWYAETWLKSIKNRVQPKQEWSEDDEVKINRIVACLKNLNVADNDILLKDVAWLKSIRPQPTWKPSELQIEALAIAIRCGIKLGTWEEEALKDLIEQLKKYRKEDICG